MLNLKITWLLIGCAALAACSQDKSTVPSSDMVDTSSSSLLSPKNILIIIADDMGMADLGSFGSEINTPNLDRLALNGVRLSNFHVAPACSPTRAMLFTGVDSHLAGLGNMSEELASNQIGKAGYEGHINDRVLTLPERLKASGYQTYLTGKWHLGGTPTSIPAARGFDRSFSLISGGASHYSDMRPAYAPSPEIKAPYYEDFEKLNSLPKNFNYSSQFYVDKMIEYIGESKQKTQPFFGVVSFTAPHWPLQAPAESIAKYKGVYDQGYEVLAAKRFNRQLDLGVIPKHAKLNTLREKVTPWNQLNIEQKKRSIRSMEIYAAMVDEMDVAVGRLISFLEQQNRLEDTLIVFLSDNGAEGHTLDETWPSEAFPKIRANIDSVHNFSYESMGAERSYVFYDAGWARAGAPSYRLHKGFPTEGGTRVAAFVNHPQLNRGQIDFAQYHVKDIVPTVLEFAGAKQLADKEGIHPISGVSMLASLKKSAHTKPNRVEIFELFNKRVVRAYPWKLIYKPLPWGKDQWYLYHLEQDLLESNNVASQYPKVVKRLTQYWDNYQKDNGVIIPSEVSGY